MKKPKPKSEGGDMLAAVFNGGGGGIAIDQKGKVDRSDFVVIVDWNDDRIGKDDSRRPATYTGLGGVGGTSVLFLPWEVDVTKAAPTVFLGIGILVGSEDDGKDNIGAKFFTPNEIPMVHDVPADAFYQSPSAPPADEVGNVRQVRSELPDDRRR